MTDNIRHDLLNSVVVIKRLSRSSLPAVEQLFNDCLGNAIPVKLPRQQLETLKQSIAILEKEIEKLSKICDNLSVYRIELQTRKP